MISLIKNVSRHVVRQFARGPDPDSFLRRITGLIHVGANTGQERTKYAAFGLRVIWIEPVPEVFRALSANLAGHSGQVAYQYLVTDKDGAEYEFNISNNNAESSSIFEFKHHRDIWPQIQYERKLRLRGVTLPTVIREQQLNLKEYQGLVMDTQGAELLVLKGAEPILDAFQFIKLEVPDFESYSGCCQVGDIEEFLNPRGFHEMSRHKFAERTQGGSYYDIVYRRKA